MSHGQLCSTFTLILAKKDVLVAYQLSWPGFQEHCPSAPGCPFPGQESDPSPSHCAPLGFHPLQKPQHGVAWCGQNMLSHPQLLALVSCAECHGS